MCIIEDDKIYNQLLTSYLNNLSKRLTRRDITFNVISCSSGEKFFDKLDVIPHIVFLDFYLDGKDEEAQNGLQILKHLKKTYPNVYVVMLTSQDETITTVELMKNGAIDYIPKDNNSFHRVDLVIGNICNKIDNGNEKKSKRNVYVMFSILIFILIAYLNK